MWIESSWTVSDSEFTFSEADAGPQLRRDLESWLDDALAVTLRILGAAAG